MATDAPILPGVTARGQLLRGLFHDRIIPPLSSRSLEPAITDLLAFAGGDLREVNGRRVPRISTRCVRHSVPKQKLARRILSIPNPRNQIFLALEIEGNWTDLLRLCRRSPVSLTTPSLIGLRAIQGAVDRRSEASERAKRSVGRRYVLHADIARFYPSIYTHSIPWAIHGKADARRDRANGLYGNRIDLWIRETQDKQTGGVPVGPDSSFLLAEVVASAIDHELQLKMGELKGTRYVDDYHLYFDTLANAERALAELHRITGQFELEINDFKTDIQILPESIEPSWKTQLRVISVLDNDHATSLKALFDRAAELARDFPQDNVFTYVVKKVETTLSRIELQDEDCKALDALLLRSAIAEPGALPTILRIFENHKRNPDGVCDVLESICLYHAPLQQASEVAWALWTAKRLNVSLSDEVANAVEAVDDDIVALVALELFFSDLMPLPEHDFELWAGYMTAEHLYSDHWLLAYEALVQHWLPSKDGSDYVTADGYFQILKQYDVKFYDTSADVEPPDSGYNDDDDDDESESSELEENDDESADEEQSSEIFIDPLVADPPPIPPESTS